MKRNLNLIIIFLFFFLICYSQTPFRILFYNVENLFDTEDNPNTADDEFTINGTRYWSKKRYYQKVNNLAKVITSIGEWSYPPLIGLCEIENEKVLKDLTLYSPLRYENYQYKLTESPDIRGINVALLYQRDQFKYLYHQSVRLNFPDNPEKKTRDILYVTGIITTKDTLDVFVCHFPSRRGGEKESEPDRLFAASKLREKVDSLFRIREKANIIIMGDFNDEPSNKSMIEYLKAKPIKKTINSQALYNLFISLEKKSNIGSYKYREQWNFLDQIIVSGNLLKRSNEFYTHSHAAQIFQPEFLFTEDIVYGGKRPKKSYHGYKYEGGFSDHLPIGVDFFIP